MGEAHIKGSFGMQRLALKSRATLWKDGDNVINDVDALIRESP
jgi:hypothetical protein